MGAMAVMGDMAEVVQAGHPIPFTVSIAQT